MKIDNTVAGIPARWLDALARVQKNFPEAVIAGGALRDLALGREVKDVDIWVKSRGAQTQRLLQEALDCEVTGMAELSDASQPSERSELDNVFDADFPVSAKRHPEQQLPDDAPIQIIALAADDLTIDSVIDRFDFGICMAATDGRVTVLHPSFLADAERQTFTYRATGRTETQMDWSLTRYQRLAGEKYAGWTLRGMDPPPAASDFDWLI